MNKEERDSCQRMKSPQREPAYGPEPNHDDLLESSGILGSLADVLLNLPDALIILDQQWRIVYANPEAGKLADQPTQELIGKTYWEGWPDSIGTQTECEFRRVMAERVPSHFCVKEEGETWLDIYAYPCQSGIAICCRDISDWKQAEIALTRREKEVRDFVENGLVGLHWVGPDGTILWANEAELKLLGYSAEEYVGHNIAEFHIDQPVIEDILRRLLNNEALHNCEARLRCKDGSVRWVLITSNVYREDGEFIHTRCFTRDITDKKHSMELHERLAAIVESSDDAVIGKDLNGIIRSWNRGAQRIFGYTAEEIIGKPVTTLAVADRADEFPNILERIARGERVDHFETKRRTKEGEVITVSLTVSPIRDSSGTVIGASKVARDITEQARNTALLRESNAALKRANADLEQFAYSASHDLQEPLRMVSIYSEMLHRKFGGLLGETGEEYIAYTVAGAQRMERLIKDLLAYMKTHTDGLTPASDADAKDALKDALLNLHGLITENKATIRYGELPVVRMHPFHLKQLFQNLIGNAIKFRSEAPPEITIRAERQDAHWLFSVQDNGIGIDPEYKELIFGIFKRLHTAHEVPGTGMGLAICQKIVELAGGRIWMESTPGGGSTFFFTV